MIKLVQYGRFFQFEDILDSRLESAIDKKLSYIKKDAHFMGNPLFGVVKLYNKKKRIFPAGLLSEVKEILNEWCRQRKEQYCVIQETNKINKFMIDESKLRPYQKDAITSIVSNGGGIISIPTGGGKTRIAVSFLDMQSKQSEKLILVPTKDLVKQWEEEVKYLCNCHVMTYQYMYRHLEELKRYNFVIMDECHHVAAKTLYKVGLSCSNAVMIGLSATPRRDDGEDMKMFGAIGKIVYEIPIRELVKQGYLLQAKVKLIDVERPVITPMDEYRDVYTKAIVFNDKRNKKICDIAMEESKKGPCLVMVDQIQHGEKLLEIMISMATEKSFVFVNGESPNRDEIFRNALDRKYDIIIATSVYGEGVSINSLKTLVLAGGGKSTIKVLQRVGRILRLYGDKKHATIFDFRDTVRFLNRHFKKRMQIYEDNGFEVENEQSSN